MRHPSHVGLSSACESPRSPPALASLLKFVMNGTLNRKLHALRSRIPPLDADERARELSAYRELRRRAVRYRWYLEVQREALGLRDHHRLDEFYLVPGALDA
jgi:hypothetical protein